MKDEKQQAKETSKKEKVDKKEDKKITDKKEKVIEKKAEILKFEESINNNNNNIKLDENIPHDEITKDYSVNIEENFTKTVNIHEYTDDFRIEESSRIVRPEEVPAMQQVIKVEEKIENILDTKIEEYSVERRVENLMDTEVEELISLSPETPMINIERAEVSQSETFLKRIDETRTEFQNQIQRFENILVEIDSPERQDSMGKIRATIGKASLLVTKKMKQFEQLCNDSMVSFFLP